jgi:catechol 2,3-dioxygenase-like lactoylglutathione lyase family enzyme
MKKFLLLTLLIAQLCSPAGADAQVVESVSIVVNDMETSLKFYTDVLNFSKESDETLYGQPWEDLYGLFGLHIRKVRMQLGDESIELIDYLTTGGRSIPEDAHSNDLTFQHIAIVVSDMDRAYAHLRSKNVVHVSTVPQTLPASIPAAAGIRAFYFQDPDKHTLELIYFPAGKGQEKWQRKTGELFLGIDHTAIGVSNTNKEHAFYSDLLGIKRKGESWNKGTEQAHLNNVKQASLHITGYRGQSGIGVEFLEYIEPGPGKGYPEDSKASDLWQWITIIEVENVNATFVLLQKAKKYRLVSAGVVDLPAMPAQRKAFIVRDPDGHAVAITGSR